MFGIDDAVAAGSKLIDDVVTRIWPDATVIEKAKIEQITEQAKQEMASVIGQLEINKIEAAHSSLLVAGWRPATGWVCAAGLAYQVVFMPIINGLCLVFGIPAPFPGIDIQLLQTIVGGMLGLGIARSVDKAKGVDTKIIRAIGTKSNKGKS